MRLFRIHPVRDAAKLLLVTIVAGFASAAAAPPRKNSAPMMPESAVTNPSPTAILTGRDAAGRAISVALALPDARTGRYRGTRFAHVPMITRAEWNGHIFWGEWNPERGDPTSHDGTAIGTAEEFDIEGPPSFAAAAAGEAFLKIGVGLLRKPEKRDKNEVTYRFFDSYEVVRPARFAPLRRGDGFVETRQEVRSDDGSLGYRYLYRVALVPKQAAIRITRTLTNVGTQPLSSEYYCHNFTQIDGDSVGPRYLLDLAFAPAPDARDATGAVASGLRLANHQVTFAVPLLPGKTAYARLIPRNADGKLLSDFTVKNTRTGASIRAAHKGSTVSRFALYAASGAVCPEPFVQITLAPGASQAWETVYTLGAEANP